ncbi:MAG: GntR family transcriptional regulator [Lachnospiraceae bacterium]|jgi:DNA-binding transcriptional regulator YhcF (GntR family)|nr:GntR family transcriptional regulator [Lachnospiraceae bacterium]
MQWMIDKERPICPQINEQIAARIALGEFLPGERLSSVRDVAVAAGVNPNTVQKAFESLEAEGLIYSVRGSGWFVADAADKAQKKLQDLAEAKTLKLFQSLKTLGYTPQQVLVLAAAVAQAGNTKEEA